MLSLSFVAINRPLKVLPLFEVNLDSHFSTHKLENSHSGLLGMELPYRCCYLVVLVSACTGVIVSGLQTKL